MFYACKLSIFQRPNRPKTDMSILDGCQHVTEEAGCFFFAADLFLIQLP